jgi:CubicO group peptidase (beta-lactamase class C family)
MSRALRERTEPRPFAKALEILEAAEGRVFTGAVLHVRIGGEVVCEAPFGVLLPGGARVRTDAAFDLASITKAFAATALLRLFDERRFALEDSIVSILPEFAGPDPRRTSVTFRHLLTHASGLPAHVSFRDEVAAPAVIARVCATPLTNAPGSSVVYSDLGFMLVGAAIQRLSDRPLASAIADLVLEPLGIVNAGYCPPPEERGRIACTERDSWRGRLLQGEVHDENCWSMGGVSAHAGLFAPASAVAELGEAYRNGGTGPARRIVSRHAALAATRECARSAEERRGLGWALKTTERQSCGTRFGPDSFGHTGYTGTSLWVDPDRALTVALLTNRVYFSRDPSPIFELRAAVHDAIVDDLSVAEAG